MPRKQKTIIEETLPDKTEKDFAADEQIVALYKVYKFNGGSKSFCFQTAEPVDEVYLQSQYPAGGKFIVYVYNEVIGEIIGTHHFDIEPKPMSNGNGNNSVGGYGSVADMQIRMLMEELNYTRQLLLQQLNGNKNGSLLEMIQVMKGIKEISPASKDPIELLIKGMELGQKNSGPSDFKSELLSAAKDVIPPALEAFAAAKQMQAGVVPAQGQPMLNPPSTSQNSLMKMGLSWIKSRILSGGMNPQFAAELLIQNAKDAMYQPLLLKIIQGDINTLIEIDAEISNEPYKSWFEEAIKEVKDWHAAQTQDNTDYDGRDGNGTDFADDEESSTAKPIISKVV